MSDHEGMKADLYYQSVGERVYDYISNRGTIHQEYCHHSYNAKRVSDLYTRLLERGLKPCKNVTRPRSMRKESDYGLHRLLLLLRRVLASTTNGIESPVISLFDYFVTAQGADKVQVTVSHFVQEGNKTNLLLCPKSSLGDWLLGY